MLPRTDHVAWSLCSYSLTFRHVHLDVLYLPSTRLQVLPREKGHCPYTHHKKMHTYTYDSNAADWQTRVAP